MESLVYITESLLELNDIRAIAEDHHYKTDLFFDTFERLNILFAESPSMWWQWQKVQPRELWFDDENDYEALEALKPNSIFVIQYHANTLSILASFLKETLRHYGGLVECKSSLQITYTWENIEKISQECP